MSEGVFSAENAQVEIFLDDGTGSPSGSALFDYVFRRASSRSMSSQIEHIPHAGYPFDEIGAGKATYRLDLAKVVESKADDLLLTDALYYIRVTERDAGYNRVRYNCKKCRRGTWNIAEPDTGAVMANSRFTCEQIVPVDV